MLVALALLLLPTPVEAQDEQQKVAEIGLYYQIPVIEDEKPGHRLFVEGYSYLSERNGVWGWVYTDQSEGGRYTSGVVGLFRDFWQFDKSSVVEFGLAAGFERMKDDTGTYRTYNRFGGNFYLGNDNLNTEVYGEYGSSKEAWLRIKAEWWVKKHLALGALHQTNDGTGPRIIISIPKTPLRLWPAIMFGEGDRKLLFSGEIIFTKR